jgi:hypothetical protein
MDLAHLFVPFQSPHVLTLGFFLFPTPLLLIAMRDPPSLEKGKAGVQLKTRPPCGVGGSPKFASV